MPLVLREHACVWLEFEAAHVPVLVQAYVVAVRDWVPVCEHVLLKPPQLPQFP